MLRPLPGEDPSLHAMDAMKQALTGFALAAMMAMPAGVSAQDVLVVTIEPGPVRVNADRLRQQIAESTSLTVVGLIDERAQGADSALTIARAGNREWVLRYRSGATDVWARQTLAPGAVRRGLVAAGRDLIARGQRQAPVARATVPAAVTPAPTPVAPHTESWVRHDVDVMDPFAATDHWDPLRVALDGELQDPFNDPSLASRPPAIWADLADPYEGLVNDGIFDPWTLPN